MATKPSPLAIVIGVIVALFALPILAFLALTINTYTTLAPVSAAVEYSPEDEQVTETISAQVKRAVLENEHAVYGSPLPTDLPSVSPDADPVLATALKAQFEKERPAEPYPATKSTIELDEWSMIENDKGDQVLALRYILTRAFNGGPTSGEAFELEVTLDPATHAVKHALFKDEDYYSNLPQGDGN